MMFRDALLSKHPATLTYNLLLTRPELQQEQPQLYGSLTGNLSQDEQTIVHGVIQQAESLAAQAAAAQANVPGLVVNGAT
jgi:hypothetical protein